MQPPIACRFCNIVAGNYNHTTIDIPFAHNDEFIAVASIGALVEGWSLIIPKRHQLSMKYVYKSPSLKDIMSTVVPRIANHYGALISFEHGANMEGSITSCGTDHAHLHLVPWNYSLFSDLQNSGLIWSPSRASEIAKKTRMNEYLFYSEIEKQKDLSDPFGYLHILEKPISQFFRQLLAKHCGRTQEANYKNFPLLDVAVQTRETLSL